MLEGRGFEEGGQSTQTGHGQACTDGKRFVIISCMKVVAVALCLGLVGGCAGGTPEAEAPDDSDELYEDDPVEQTKSGGDAQPSEAAEPADGAAADAGGAATPEDMQEILQLVINDEALEPYLKLEEPGRFPMQISGSDIP